MSFNITLPRIPILISHCNKCLWQQKGYSKVPPKVPPKVLIITVALAVLVPGEIDGRRELVGTLGVLHESKVTEFVLVWCLDAIGTLGSHETYSVTDVDRSHILETSQADV